MANYNFSDWKGVRFYNRNPMRLLRYSWASAFLGSLFINCILIHFSSGRPAPKDDGTYMGTGPPIIWSKYGMGQQKHSDPIETNAASAMLKNPQPMPYGPSPMYHMNISDAAPAMGFIKTLEEQMHYNWRDKIPDINVQAQSSINEREETHNIQELQTADARVKGIQMEKAVDRPGAPWFPLDGRTEAPKPEPKKEDRMRVEEDDSKKRRRVEDTRSEPVVKEEIVEEEIIEEEENEESSSVVEEEKSSSAIGRKK